MVASTEEENREALLEALWCHKTGFELKVRRLPRVVRARYGQANSKRYLHREPTP